jgi:rubrerythrin
MGATRRSQRLLIDDGEADTSAIAELEASRRDAVRLGIAAGGAVLGAWTVPALLSARNAFAAADDDATILSSAITLENTAVAAYETASQSKLLDHQVKAVASLFRRHEQEHVDALSAALKGLGGSPPTATNAKVLAPLQRVGSQNAVLAFAIELETMALAAYYEAHRKLRDTKLLQTGAQIMAAEGQHLVVLRQALKRNPAPNAFETGKRAG